MLLIADDNPQVRRMIRSMIEDIDPEILECEDGAAAVEAFERYRPDWVLMDINMQPLDGLAATREIVNRHAEAKIIVITQHQDARTRDTALKMGACAFVGKDDLMSLRDLIHQKKAKIAS